MREFREKELYYRIGRIKATIIIVSHNPWMGNAKNTRVFVGTVFLQTQAGRFSIWRYFLAVSSFAVPGTGKIAGIFFGGLKYGRFVLAVPGTAKFNFFMVLFNILWLFKEPILYTGEHYSSLLVGTNILVILSGYSSVSVCFADTGGAVSNLAVFFWRLTVIHFFSESLSAVPGTVEFRR